VSVSNKFRFIGNNLLSILQKVITNQNFLRYIKYLYNDPLSPTYSDITGRLIDFINSEDILLRPFDPTVLEESKVRVFFYPHRGNFPDRASSVDTLALDILVPWNYWILEGKSQLRAYEIAYEFCKSIDGQQVNGAGTKLVEITDWQQYKVNDQFGLLNLHLTVSNASIGQL
jgi:hypothetical protein